METAGRFRQITTVPVTQSHVGQVHTLRNAAGGLFRGKVLGVTGQGVIAAVQEQKDGDNWLRLLRVERRQLVGAEIVEEL